MEIPSAERRAYCTPVAPPTGKFYAVNLLAFRIEKMILDGLNAANQQIVDLMAIQQLQKLFEVWRKLDHHHWSFELGHWSFTSLPLPTRQALQILNALRRPFALMQPNDDIRPQSPRVLVRLVIHPRHMPGQQHVGHAD